MISRKSLLVEVFSPQNPRNRVELEISSERPGLYTALPQEVLEKFGVKTDVTIQHVESNDRLITLPLWQIGISAHGRESITLAISSEEASIGYLTLAELGLMLRGEEADLLQITTYDDPLIYALTFEWIPETYASTYYIKQARELYRELLRLYDEWIFALNNKNILEERNASSFATAVMSIIFYNLNSMLASFYIGALPSIALGLRLSLEALIAGYYGDLDPKLREKYPYALIRLERSLKYIHGKSFREFCQKRLVNYTMNAQPIIGLWNDVSFKFIHSIGLVRAISRSRELPSIAMGCPFVAYGKGDEELLSQLTNLVKRYREVFISMIDEWLQNVRNSSKRL